jgi:hypothetical protein
MTIGILAAVLGVLISATAIIIPRIVNRGNNPEDHTDSLAYLKQTGRSAEDVVRGNAGPAFQQQSNAGSPQADGSDVPPPGKHAG